MPVEIRQLHITVNVNREGSGMSKGGNKAAEAENNQALVREAVEQVLHIIESKKER